MTALSRLEAVIADVEASMKAATYKSDYARILAELRVVREELTKRGFHTGEQVIREYYPDDGDGP